MIFFWITYLVIFAICVGVIYLLYFILKNYGYPKGAITLASVLSLLFMYLLITEIFKDELFSKSDAIELLMEHDIALKDDFQLIHNKFGSGLDNHLTFTLQITLNDKESISELIKQSKNFNIDKDTPIYPLNRNIFYSGPKKFKNYETKKLFVRELFAPNGIDYAPTWRKVKIHKKENKLVFEDIIE